MGLTAYIDRIFKSFTGTLSRTFAGKR